jgi:hypothetical protein
MLRPDELAMQHLRERELTCSQLGDIIWGRPARNPQSYARPAGRLLLRIQREGLVTSRQDGRLRLWQATRRAIRIVEGQP